MANSGFERSSSNSAQERNAQHAQPQHNRSRSSAVEKGMGVVWLKKINKLSTKEKADKGLLQLITARRGEGRSHRTIFDKQIKAKSYDGDQQKEQRDSRDGSGVGDNCG